MVPPPSRSRRPSRVIQAPPRLNFRQSFQWIAKRIGRVERVHRATAPSSGTARPSQPHEERAESHLPGECYLRGLKRSNEHRPSANSYRVNSGFGRREKGSISGRGKSARRQSRNVGVRRAERIGEKTDRAGSAADEAAHTRRGVGECDQRLTTATRPGSAHLPGTGRTPWWW